MYQWPSSKLHGFSGSFYVEIFHGVADSNPCMSPLCFGEWFVLSVVHCLLTGIYIFTLDGI